MKRDIVGIAGSLESSDVLALVDLSVEGDEIIIQMDGPSVTCFGHAIKKTVLEIMDSLHIERALVKVQERGALDCTLRARVEAAARRALDKLRSEGGYVE